MTKTILNAFNSAAVVMTLYTGAIAPQALAQKPRPQNRQDTVNQLLYRRAFEVALWAMPAADSFAAREAVKRDLHGKPNDVAINTKPLNSDAHLVALQNRDSVSARRTGFEGWPNRGRNPRCHQRVPPIRNDL